MKGTHLGRPARSSLLNVEVFTIQLAYYNQFSSIWEYNVAAEADQIDFVSFIGRCCPLCDKTDCYRKIAPYFRTAIDLLPHRKGEVMILRFQCRTLELTFSLLPVQLIPYHHYTLMAVVFMLLLAQDLVTNDSLSLCAVAQHHRPAGSLITGFLLSCWLRNALAGLHRAHSALHRWFRLFELRSGSTIKTMLDEVHGYFYAFSRSRHPGRRQDVHAICCRFSRTAKMFLIGVPAQLRPQGAPAATG